MTKELIAAIEAAKAAGKYARKNFGQLEVSHISLKSRNDFVTDVDKKSEELAIRQIRRRFPYDAVLAEESGDHAGTGKKSDRRWIIDPLDGTTNFIHSVPIFCTSVALEEDGELFCGAIYLPMSKELFTAERGRGAFMNNHRIHVTRNFQSKDLLLATGFPYRIENNLDATMGLFKDFLLESAGVRRPGSAAIDLAYTACGKFDGFWEIDLKSWDVAAGALIVKEAGGIVTDFKGQEGYLASGNIIASNGRIHAWMLEKAQKNYGTNFE
jgi:myo-inositol-1(or 4)-monophosphatase